MKALLWRHRWKVCAVATIVLYTVALIAGAHVMAESTVRHYGPWTCWFVSAMLAAFPAVLPMFIVGIWEDDRGWRKPL